MIRDQTEVCPLSREVMSRNLVALNLYPLDCRATFAFPSSHTRRSIGLPYGLLSLGLLLEGNLQAYHVSREYQSGLGLASPPVAQRLRQVS